MSSFALAPGTIFGEDFIVVRPIGEGGMGAVYLVEQQSTRKRRALKVMHPGRGNDALLRKRFEQEAKVGALIESEHVVDVIAAGIDAKSGTPWMVMELLEGEDLEAALARRGWLPHNEIHTILGQLCHALGAAHVIPVVHRDLKPSNVFLARPRLEGTSFIVKVLDFGIAKVVTENPTTTNTIGTPLWMAPEQSKSGAPIVPATDVWSLGLLTFTLLTGRCFWLAANDPEARAMAVMREVVIDPIPTASERARALGVAERLPAGFDAWFARCLVREVDDRFPNAAEAWKALAPLLGSSKSDLAQTATVHGPSSTRTFGLAPTVPAVTPLADSATLDAVGMNTVARPSRPRVMLAIGALGVVAAASVGAAVLVTRGGSEPSAPAGPPSTLATTTPPPIPSTPAGPVPTSTLAPAASIAAPPASVSARLTASALPSVRNPPLRPTSNPSPTATGSPAPNATATATPTPSPTPTSMPWILR